MDAVWTVSVIAGLSLVSLLVVVLSSFTKITVVLTILRNAIGVPGVPSNLVITGLSTLLTLFILAPVAEQVMVEARPVVDMIENESRGESDTAHVEPLDDTAARARRYAGVVEQIGAPIRQFLERHVHAEDRETFAALATALRLSARDGHGRGASGSQPSSVDERDLLVLALAFVTSELTEAFAIGVVLLIPFLVIDLVVAIVLVALGMPSLSSATLALPLKLLLFVLVDGWRLLVNGLISGYL